jgi:hypothetical protein
MVPAPASQAGAVRQVPKPVLEYAQGGEVMPQLKTVIRCVCCYCKLHYADKDGQGVSGDSHGICPGCESAPKCTLCAWPVGTCGHGRRNETRATKGGPGMSLRGDLRSFGTTGRENALRVSGCHQRLRLALLIGLLKGDLHANLA